MLKLSNNYLAKSLFYLASTILLDLSGILLDQVKRIKFQHLDQVNIMASAPIGSRHRQVTMLYRPPEMADIELNFRKNYTICSQVHIGGLLGATLSL